MKKSMILAGAALLALVACNKSETVVKESQSEINFKAVSGAATKGAELDGTDLPTTYDMYVAATSSQNDSYFVDQQFKKFAGENWQHTDDGSAANPIYWPLGGAKLDFLAFALPNGKYGTSAGQIKPAFAALKVATGLTVDDWNVYDNEFELLYAAKNSLVSTTSPVALNFVHALSCVIFNVKLAATVDPSVKINSITFDELVKSGDFAVDNTKNDLVATWTPAAATASTPFVITAAAAARSTLNTTATTVANFVNNTTDLKAQTDFAQIGDSKLMIPQPARNFTINYTIGANTLNYHVNIPRQDWEAGKVYEYNLTITLNEITVAPTVTDWVGDPTNPAIPLGLQ